MFQILLECSFLKHAWSGSAGAAPFCYFQICLDLKMKIEYTLEIFFRKFYKKNEQNLISSKLGGKLCIQMYCHRKDYFASFNSQKQFLECFHFVFRNLNRITSFMLSSVRFYHERQLQIVVAFSSPAFGLTFCTDSYRYSSFISTWFHGVWWSSGGN